MSEFQQILLHQIHFGSSEEILFCELHNVDSAIQCMWTLRPELCPGAMFVGAYGQVLCIDLLSRSMAVSTTWCRLVT